jgi:hypothetical protein
MAPVRGYRSLGRFALGFERFEHFDLMAGTKCATSHGRNRLGLEAPGSGRAEGMERGGRGFGAGQSRRWPNILILHGNCPRLMIFHLPSAEKPESFSRVLALLAHALLAYLRIWRPDEERKRI